MDLTFMRGASPKLNTATSTGQWSLIVALAVACTVLADALGPLGGPEGQRQQGRVGFVLRVLNTASGAGYGGVVATPGGVALIKEAVLKLSPGNPLILDAIAMNILAGTTGSSSGGLSIALEAPGADHLRTAQETELLHGVAVLAACGMDRLPHCGAIITQQAICKLTHKHSYPTIAAMTMAFPVTALMAVITLGTALESF